MNFCQVLGNFHIYIIYCCGIFSKLLYIVIQYPLYITVESTFFPTLPRKGMKMKESLLLFLVLEIQWLVMGWGSFSKTYDLACVSQTHALGLKSLMDWSKTI